MKRLKELREKKKITMQELGDLLNVSRSTVSLYESRQRQPDLKTLKKIADIFNVSVDYLLGHETNNVELTLLKNNTVKIPIYGKIPAGVPMEMVDESFIEEFIEADAKIYRGSSTYFGLKVKGNSMFPEFRNGDIVIFKQQSHCENGDFCAVSINHTECTFKKVLKKESGITLMPLNPDYDPMFFTKKEIINLPITILGVVKEVRRSY